MQLRPCTVPGRPGHSASTAGDPSQEAQPQGTWEAQQARPASAPTAIYPLPQRLLLTVGGALAIPKGALLCEWYGFVLICSRKIHETSTSNPRFHESYCSDKYQKRGQFGVTLKKIKCMAVQEGEAVVGGGLLGKRGLPGLQEFMPPRQGPAPWPHGTRGPAYTKICQQEDSTNVLLAWIFWWSEC